MNNIQNAKPMSYRPPNSRISKLLIQTLLSKMIGSDQVYLDFSNGLPPPDVLDRYRVILAPPKLWGMAKILIAPTMQSGETFRKGDWYLKKGTLMDLIAEMYLNKNRLFYRYFLFLSKFKGLKFFLKQRFFVKFFTRKVRNHYDVDSDLYAAFLDEEMVYTCAIFNDSSNSLLDAQKCKLDTVISRMKLPDGQKNVLEIGSGWGSLSRRIVSTDPDVEYLGLTISNGQMTRANELDRERLDQDQASRIQYRCEDYLDHEPVDEGGYDGIAVIGMMEHVGLGHHAEFLQKICSLLKPEGRAVIHTIIAESSGEPTNSWIDRHIFHGGYAPSLAEIMSAAENCRCDVENVFTHAPNNYRQTIELWIENFLENWDQYRRENIPDWSEERCQELFRIWYFYLSAVRNMFVPNAMKFRIAHVVVKKA